MAGHKPFSEIRRKPKPWYYRKWVRWAWHPGWMFWHNWYWHRDHNDPLSPMDGEFSSWQDFVDRVARPMVRADGDETQEQEAMRLYVKASPYFICVSMVMMDERLKDAAKTIDLLESPW